MNLTGHVHVSAISFVVVALYMIIALFFFRYISTRYSDSTVGKALAFILGS